MYLRDAPDLTLEKLLGQIESAPGETVRTANDAVSVSLLDPAKQVVRVGSHEVPWTEGSLESIAGWLDVPKPFLARQGEALQEHIVNFLLAQNPSDEGLFRLTEHGGIAEIRHPGQAVIESRDVIERLMKVIDPKAEVVEYWSTPDHFRLDTTVPNGFKRGIGGDKPRGKSVGDLTKGGVRIAQNRKLNHAPEVSEFYYRLVCTNGMEIAEAFDKIDMRGMSVDEVLMEIELTAQAIMGRADDRIRRFYELRDTKVPTPEQAIYRIADERGISPRVATEIARALPTITDSRGDTTMFEVVNLMTNFANEPSISRRAGARLLLERAGGSVVHEHSDRCTHCQSKLN